MGRRLQVAMIICAVVVVTSIISHGIIRWLRIETTFGGYWVTGPGDAKLHAFMAGSSLAGDGLSWTKIGVPLNARIGGWAVAGSSPVEWERFQGRASVDKLTILVVSAYDLNEYFLCDFRAQVVPLGQTISDLWQSAKTGLSASAS